MHYSRVPRLRRALAIPLLCLAFGAVTAPAGARPLPECVAAPCASDAGIPPLILAYWRGRTEPYLIRSVQRAGLPDDTPIYYGSYWGTGVNTRPPPTTPPPPPPPRPARARLCRTAAMRRSSPSRERTTGRSAR